MTQSATIDANQDTAQIWRNHLLALAAVLALILVEFRGAVSAAIGVWEVSPTYSHCFLIIPIIGWLIWEKKDLLKNIRPAVEPRILPLIVPLLALWWLGELATVNEVRQYAVVGMMQIIIIALLGFRVVRQIWFPVFFLLFLVPTGEYLIGPMQQFATRFVDITLNLLGIPHYTEGTVIELTTGKFEIAEACAGLRFLIATVTLGVLFSYLMYVRIFKVVLFLLACVIVPLIGNGLRCVGIILLAHFTNNEYGAGADHIVYGWGFNVAILLVLIFLGSLFRDESQKEPPGAPLTKRRDTTVSIAVVAILTAVLVSAGPAWALWRDHGDVTLDKNVIQLALQSAGWRDDKPADNWQPYFPEADARFLEGRDFGARVNLFVGYYARPRAGKTVTAHLNRPWNETWNASSGAVVGAKLGGATVKLNEFVIDSGATKRLVWFTYWTNGTVTNSSIAVRLAQAEAALGGHEGQAVIVVSTPLDVPIDEARERLSAALAAAGPVSASLRSAADEPSDGQSAG